jgi:hypothetical protein
MKLFFEICKEFFDMLYLPFVSDIIENDIIRENLDDEELDEEKGFKEQENRYDEQNEDYKYIQDEKQENYQDIQYHREKERIEDKENLEEDDENFCGCEFFRQTLSIINARIYKLINDNKSE